ncbi:mechanosensitive ion channel protein MscS [Bacteroidia bacterium]|nr:mechanosensitive ion channel protein MscS [Bacteroidia bacterium]
MLAKLFRIAGLALVVAVVSSCTQETSRPAIHALSGDSAAVVPFGDTLFFLYGSQGAVNAVQRARAVSENIVILQNDPFFNADSLRVVVAGKNYNIVHKGKIIVSVTDEQAQRLNRHPLNLAEGYCRKVAMSIKSETKREGTLWLSVLLRIGLGLLLLFATYFAIKYLNIWHRYLRGWVRKQKRKTPPVLHKWIDAGTQTKVLLLLLRVLRLVLILLVLYICLFAFFRLFPATIWLSDTLLGYILNPLKSAAIDVWHYIPHLFAIIIIVIIFRFVTTAIRTVSKRIEDGTIVIKGFFPDWTKPTFNIIRVVLFVFMFILIFPHLPNSESNVFQGVSVFMGLLLSLGSTSFIGNLIAGLVITYMRPFQTGDCIKMGDNFGNVIEKSSLVTRIKTTKNEVVTIPNSIIMSTQTINYTNSAQQYGLILHSKITMGYSVPWRKVHELLIEAGLATPHVLQEPKPFVLQVALDDFYVEYEINIYTNNANEIPQIYSALNKNIQDIFAKAEIELVMPHVLETREGPKVEYPVKTA